MADRIEGLRIKHKQKVSGLSFNSHDNWACHVKCLICPTTILIDWSVSTCSMYSVNTIITHRAVYLASSGCVTPRRTETYKTWPCSCLFMCNCLFNVHLSLFLSTLARAVRAENSVDLDGISLTSHIPHYEWSGQVRFVRTESGHLSYFAQLCMLI